MRCFMGHAGCNPESGVRGTMFITMYIVGLIGGGNLIRYGEGATYLAIVTVNSYNSTDLLCYYLLSRSGTE